MYTLCSVCHCQLTITWTLRQGLRGERVLHSVHGQTDNFMTCISGIIHKDSISFIPSMPCSINCTLCHLFSLHQYGHSYVVLSLRFNARNLETLTPRHPVPSASSSSIFCSSMHPVCGIMRRKARRRGEQSCLTSLVWHTSHPSCSFSGSTFSSYFSRWCSQLSHTKHLFSRAVRNRIPTICFSLYLTHPCYLLRRCRNPRHDIRRHSQQSYQNIQNHTFPQVHLNTLSTSVLRLS